MVNFGYGLLANQSVAPTYVITPITANLCVATPNGTFGLNLPPFSGTPASVLGSVFSQLASNARGGWVHCRAGDYNMGTVSPAVTFGTGGILLTGEGWGGGYNGYTFEQPTTRFLAGTNNQTIFKATSGQILHHFIIKDFALLSNGFTGLTGLDLTGTESSANGSELSHINITPTDTTGAVNGAFATGVICDGNEDLTLYQVSSSTNGGTDIHWNVPAGNIKLRDCTLGSGLSLVGNARLIEVTGGLLNAIELNSTPASFAENILSVTSVWMDQSTGVGRLQLNGQTCGSAVFRGCTIGMTASIPMIVGSGTLRNLGFDNCSINGHAASNWTSGAPTVTKSNTSGTSHMYLTTPTGFPFTVDGNGNF